MFTNGYESLKNRVTKLENTPAAKAQQPGPTVACLIGETPPPGYGAAIYVRTQEAKAMLQNGVCGRVIVDPEVPK
jgi:hypothetical protein